VLLLLLGFSLYSLKFWITALKREPMPQRTADELVKEGERLSKLGNLVVFLYPSQEWMAVQTQMPFLRYERIPLGDGQAPGG
jgi:hypothetical protein